MDDTDVRMLWLGLLLIAAGLLYAFGIVPASAQYGGGWGIYGPYGRPPEGAYGPPRLPRPRPAPWGPQMEPCIYRGDCRGPRYEFRRPAPRFSDEEIW